MFHHIAQKQLLLAFCIEDSKKTILIRMFLLLGVPKNVFFLIKPFLDDTFRSTKYKLLLQ